MFYIKIMMNTHTSNYYIIYKYIDLDTDEGNIIL